MGQMSSKREPCVVQGFWLTVPFRPPRWGCRIGKSEGTGWGGCLQQCTILQVGGTELWNRNGVSKVLWLPGLPLSRV